MGIDPSLDHFPRDVTRNITIKFAKHVCSLPLILGEGWGSDGGARRHSIVLWRLDSAPGSLAASSSTSSMRCWLVSCLVAILYYQIRVYEILGLVLPIIHIHAASMKQHPGRMRHTCRRPGFLDQWLGAMDTPPRVVGFPDVCEVLLRVTPLLSGRWIIRHM
jgi:hypothetical protein